MGKQQTLRYGLMLGSLGVVFGDIGTSPLYALKIAFGLAPNGAMHNSEYVYGLLSLLIWVVTLIVSIKYIAFIMRANNHGEGGIMALVAFMSGSSLRYRSLLIGIGLAGVALFYGDSIVTPAISVLSAVEGVSVVAPDLHHLIIPLTLVVLSGLFILQRSGTATIGKLFGPVMLLWFGAIGAAGLVQVLHYPVVLQALSPLAGLLFIADHPHAAFIALGAIILAVTGAEALYADMGHFGRSPIATTWFMVVFPALTLCYLGQAALVLNSQTAIQNPFFELFPSSLQVPVILLATAATLIASQAVISGAFSLTRQAMQLRYVPRLLVNQTSNNAGQIYLPFVNFIMFVLVALLVVSFGSSERLAGAYGVAVSGTLAVDSILFIAVMARFWHSRLSIVAGYCAVFLSLDMLLIGANTIKIPHGGWLPLGIAIGVLLIMRAWTGGQRRATAARRRIEKPLEDYIAHLPKDLVRLPGQAVYIGHHEGLTPTALRSAVEELHELHQKVVIVYVKTALKAHVPHHDRASFDSLGYADGISAVTITYGFHDTPNIPQTLSEIRHTSDELDFDANKAAYFISLSHVLPDKQSNLPRWQKALYTIMARNALSASDYYQLPTDKTIEMRTILTI